MKLKDDKKTDVIFGATLDLIVQVGIAGITMASIAKQAKIATGTLYIYFKSKEELITALYVKSKKESAEVFFKKYDPNEPFKLAFKRIWLNMLQYRFERYPEAVFIEQFYHSPFITQEIKQTTAELLVPLFQLMERGKKEQSIKNIDTMLLLTYMVGSINELVNLSHYNSLKLTKAQTDTAFQLCWDGVRS